MKRGAECFLFNALFFCRAHKGAGVGNGDTPPEDEPGGGLEDMVLADMEEDEIDDYSLRKPPLPLAKADGKNQQDAELSSSQRQSGKVAAAAESANRRGELDSKASRKNSDNADDASVPPLHHREAVPPVASTNTNTISSPAERHTRRSKVKERGEKASESSTVSRGTRQVASGRARVHVSRGNDALSNQMAPPGSNVGSSTSGTIRISPMTVVGIANVSTTPTSSPRKGRKEDGWKEVGRR